MDSGDKYETITSMRDVKEQKQEPNSRKTKNTQSLIIKLTAGYRMDFGQLARIVSCVWNSDKRSLKREDVAKELGQSPARIGRMWLMLTSLGITEKGSYTLTHLGQIVCEYDMYFENDALLWLLHYYLSSDKRVAIWNTFANDVVPNEKIITTDIVMTYLKFLRELVSPASFKTHLRKDVNSILNAYTRQAFSKLTYIVEDSDGSIHPGIDIDVPDLSVLAALYVFRTRFFPRASGLEMQLLMNSRNSPLVLFRQSEASFRGRLERLHNTRLIEIESRGDLDQIRFVPNLALFDIVRMFY